MNFSHHDLTLYDRSYPLASTPPGVVLRSGLSYITPITVEDPHYPPSTLSTTSFSQNTNILSDSANLFHGGNGGNRILLIDTSGCPGIGRTFIEYRVNNGVFNNGYSYFPVTVTQPLTLDPSGYPNMIRWFDAQSLSLSEGAGVGVSGNFWPDLSPSGAHLYSNSNTLFPTYRRLDSSISASISAPIGLPCVSFSGDGTGNYLSGIPSHVTGDQTWFLVYLPRYTGTSVVFGGTNLPFDYFLLQQLVGSDDVGVQFGNGEGFSIAGTISNYNNLKYLSLSMTGSAPGKASTGFFQLGAFSQTTVNTKSFFTGRYHRLGGLGGATSQIFSGAICELIAYNTGMTLQQQSDFLIKYFYPKWAVL